MADNSSFCRILTLLRKERGITQKDAAASLGISQALLSHYEKGIRECGLDFVVRASSFYGVSCDYLLGCSPDRSGLTLSVDEIPEEDAKNDTKYRGSVLPILNKKLITNSMAVLYDLLIKCPDKALIGEISNYLMLAVYKMFRRLYSANPKNQSNMFSIPGQLFQGYSDAAMLSSDARISAMLSDESINGIENVTGTEKLLLTTESIAAEYPLLASSLFNLIQQAERTAGCKQ